ncbi:hypothetical protein HDU78_004801 [Chytriomyces hyalinus]|nr:hypothetical protein HDU78_004801 [Chytriomyces hyalinus]
MSFMQLMAQAERNTKSVDAIEQRVKAERQKAEREESVRREKQRKALLEAEKALAKQPPQPPQKTSSSSASHSASNIKPNSTLSAATRIPAKPPRPPSATEQRPQSVKAPKKQELTSAETARKKTFNFNQLMAKAEKVSLTDPVSIADSKPSSTAFKNQKTQPQPAAMSKGKHNHPNLELIPLGSASKRNEKSAMQILEARHEADVGSKKASVNGHSKLVERRDHGATDLRKTPAAGGKDATRASAVSLKNGDNRSVMKNGKEVDPRRIPVSKEIDPRRIPVSNEVDPRRIPAPTPPSSKSVSASAKDRVSISHSKPSASSKSSAASSPSLSNSSSKEMKRKLGETSGSNSANGSEPLRKKQMKSGSDKERDRDARGPIRPLQKDYGGVKSDDIWSILGVKRRAYYESDDDDDMEVGFNSVRAEESRSARLARLEDAEEERREQERLRKKGKL